MIDYKAIQNKLDESKNPLFIYHDDPDGLASFLLLYRYKREGHGVVVKSKPIVDMKFIHKVSEYNADIVFILDVPMVDEEFINKCQAPIIWIDHHDPTTLKGITYINPKQHGSLECTTWLCYNIVKTDLWIAMVGAVSDWQIPEFAPEFIKKYPDLFDEKITHPGQALHDTPVGTLARLFGNILKGKTQDALKNVKLLIDIKTPYELLNQQSKNGKKLFNYFKRINTYYKELIDQAIEKIDPDSKLIVFIYDENKISMSSDVSNELIYRYPDRVVFVGRKKNDEVRMSIRSSSVKVKPILELALKEVEGYGGGHEHACGASIKEKDFDRFLEFMEKNV